MATSILTLDLGNSTLDAMWHSEPPLRKRLESGDEAGLREFAAGRRAHVAAAVSVVGVGGLTVAERLLAETGCPLLIAGQQLPCPLTIAYREPERLGPDRWVGAYAAWKLYGPAVVVDCGSAVTVDFVDREGVFRGGLIAPGAQAMARGLAAQAPGLPVADLEVAPEIPALSPEAAVSVGVQLGFRAMVDGLAVLLRESLGSAGATLVLTGGGAPAYLAGSGLEYRHHGDLIHQGLRWLAEKHGDSNS